MSAHIKTWQERQEDAVKAGQFAGFPSDYMPSEIADLRARIAELEAAQPIASVPAQPEQIQPPNKPTHVGNARHCWHTGYGRDEQVNAHQRRIARRVVRRQLGESPSYEALYASDGDPFDDYDDEDEPEACPDCHGDGRDAMSDYLLPCKLCGGFGN